MKVTLYTDGAARGNPDGPGGYGAVLQFIDSTGKLHERELSAGYRKTTNNRMELMAAIVGLEALVKPCQVELYSDSKYGCLQSALDRWMAETRLEEIRQISGKKQRSVEQTSGGDGTASGNVSLGERA